jgi:hypothetical protein
VAINAPLDAIVLVAFSEGSSTAEAFKKRKK